MHARPHRSRKHTNMRLARLSVAGLAGGALLALAAAPLAASAHVTVTPSGTAAGSYTVLTFAYSHGCDVLT